jgi:hypothetical protein
MASVSQYAALIEPVARFFFGEPNRGLSSIHELRFGSRGSLSIDLRNGTWYDHERGEGGGLLDLVARENHFEVRESPRWLHEHGFELDDDPKLNGGRQPRGKIVATYPYMDENGKVLFEVVRLDPKDFRQRRPDGSGGYIWQIRGTRNVPYRLPELRAREHDEDLIYIVEGEKDVDMLRTRFGVVATCNAGGVGKWRDELSEFFKDANVIVIPDNDPQKRHPKTNELMWHPDGRRPILPGQDHAHAVAASLQGIAASVRYLDLSRYWPEMPRKGDMSDWIMAGGTIEALNLLVAQAPEWSPELMREVKVEPITPVFLFPIDERAIDPRDWIVPGLLMRKQVTVLVAPSGSGKSLLTLQLGVACAQGVRWSGWTPRKKFKVLVINSEDDEQEVRRRLAAFAKSTTQDPERHGIEVDQIAIRNSFAVIDTDAASAVLADKTKSPTAIATFDARKKTLIREPLLEQIIATIKLHEFDLVFVDPFAETFLGDENSNNELKVAGGLWREVARRGNCAVCLIHHTKKYASGMAGDVDAARGAGALIGIARIVSTLFPMTPKEAEGMLEPEERSKRVHYLRYDDAKANLNIISSQARWFYKDTIELDNARVACGDEPAVPCDKVGVLVPWKPKGRREILEAEILSFFEAIDKGELDNNKEPIGEYYTFANSGRSAQRYIGTFAQEFFALNTLKEAEKYIKGWRHRLAEIKYRSPRSARHWRNRVVSELSEEFPNKKANGNGESENGELFAQPAPMPASKSKSKPAPLPRFRVIADCGQDTICLVCRKADGNVKRIKDSHQVGSQTETLHEACAPQWFKDDA